MKFRKLFSALLVLVVFSQLSGCSLGPQTLGGKCDQLTLAVEKVRGVTSGQYSEEYPDLLLTVYVEDNYVLNDVIGEFSSLGSNPEGKFGSAENDALFQDWWSGLTGMNGYADSSGEYVDFFSSDLGPTMLKDYYQKFETASDELLAVCETN